MNKTFKSKSSFIKIGLIALVVVLILTGALLLLELWDEKQGTFPSHEIDDDVIVYNGKEYAPNNSVETFLVLGLDKVQGEAVSDSYNNDQQSDFIMLFVFNNDAKEFTAIHINRDTMADMNVLGVAGNKVDTVNKQLALAHTYGNGRDISCRNTADAISDLLLGVKINHYMSLALDSVAVMNDLVGGVEVTVLDDFDGIDDTLIKGETVTLKGEQALRYVRTRYGLDDSTNNTRMLRQQQYINALYEKMHKCAEEDEQFIVDASLEMSDYIVSDRSVTQLQELSKKINNYTYKGIVDFDGEFKQGEKFIEFYPDYDSIEKTVVELFYKSKD